VLIWLDCHNQVWGYHSKLQLGKINCYLHNIGQCHINFSNSNQSNFTTYISHLWPSLSSTSRKFGIEILHKMCLAYVNPFVMVWLIILRDMFILNYYYLMWIDIEFFCTYTYVVGHLVARLSWWVLSSKSHQRFFFQLNKMSWVDVACYNIGSFFLFKFASEELN